MLLERPVLIFAVTLVSLTSLLGSPETRKEGTWWCLTQCGRQAHSSKSQSSMSTEGALSDHLQDTGSPPSVPAGGMLG